MNKSFQSSIPSILIIVFDIKKSVKRLKCYVLFIFLAKKRDFMHYF